MIYLNNCNFKAGKQWKSVRISPQRCHFIRCPPLFIVPSQTTVTQSGSLRKSRGSLGVWHSTDDSIPLNITSPLFGFPSHLENTTPNDQPGFQTEQIKLTLNERAGPATTALCRVSSLVYLPAEQLVTKHVGERVTAVRSARATLLQLFRAPHLRLCTIKSAI